MKIIKDSFLIFSLILLIGRAAGMGAGVPVFYHAGGHSSVTLTKTDGYFVIELLQGGDMTININGISREVTAPGEGLFIMEPINVSPVNGAVMELQRATGLRK